MAISKLGAALIAATISSFFILLAYRPVQVVRYPTDDLPMKYALRHYEAIIEHSLEDYEFPPNTNHRNFTPATGGRPLRNIIVTTWRSGSTFLGEVVNAVPGNFYHYEPLLDFGMVSVGEPPESGAAVRNLRKLLNCDYEGMERYLEYGRSNAFMFVHNTRLWSQCEVFPRYCWSREFLGEFCKLFPFQSVKTVRMRLKVAEELLKDDNLDVRVLLLVRDPRGTVQSRRRRTFCRGHPACEDPARLCRDLASDHAAAAELRRAYPDRVRALRYEDLAADPRGKTRELLGFFRLEFHGKVAEYLESHTKRDAGGVQSTRRDSKSTPFHWKTDLDFSEVRRIQNSCGEAMEAWGYVRAEDEGHLREFNPVGNYTIE